MDAGSKGDACKRDGDGGMRVITITESPSMPGSYRLAEKDTGTGKKPVVSDVRGCDAQAAAAAMVEASMHAPGGRFIMFAPEKVLKLIPAEMRSA